MNPLLSSAWSRIRNLPFILQGDSPEKKLRLTLLIAGVASIVAGIFMATLNFSRGHHDIGCLYIASIALGATSSSAPSATGWSGIWRSLPMRYYLPLSCCCWWIIITLLASVQNITIWWP
ncbi:hypothetical protein QM327_13555 [Pantoea dispersa]|uniref:hypothetical protein n=1 Tax=Pantoea dispersa TaxID=59814 RepID=UPI0024B745BB|nr:hypothetical protein [Pantoea dispersa]MDI9767571.1 hypothetical protein [Pantoea dispersa]